MKNKRYNLIISLFLIVQIIFVQIISNYPSFVERYYSNGIYPYISRFLRILFGWIPFSFGDVLIAILVFLFFRFLVRLIRTKFTDFLSKLLQLTASVSIIYGCFYLFWGFNYFREPLSKNLGFTQQKYTTEALVKTTKKIIFQLNSLQIQLAKNDTLLVKNPYTTKEMYAKAIAGFTEISKTYPQLKYQQKSVKNSLMSLLQTYNGTSGYMNPLTGEAQINDRIPTTGFPATACHEMAHQLGFAAENEANFVGFLASISNDDLYFQYAGYRMAFSYAISEVGKRDRKLAAQLWQQTNKGILKDFRASGAFWRQYQNPIEPIVKKGYNSYLKANKQQQGIASYNYVVDLLISYLNE